MNKTTVSEAIARNLIHEGDVVEVKSATSGKTFTRNVVAVNPNDTFTDEKGINWGKAEFVGVKVAANKPQTVREAVDADEISIGETLKIQSKKTGKIVEVVVSDVDYDNLTVTDEDGIKWGKSTLVENLGFTDDESSDEGQSEYDSAKEASRYLKVGQEVVIESANSGKQFTRTVTKVSPGLGFTDNKGYFWDESLVISCVNPTAANVTPTPTSPEASGLRDRLQNAQLPKEDRLLREEGLEDRHGVPTADAREYALQVLIEKNWTTLRGPVAKLLEKEIADAQSEMDEDVDN